MEALILVAESGGRMMFARIRIVRALNRHVERAFDPTRKSRIGSVASWPATANFPSRDHQNEFLQADIDLFCIRDTRNRSWRAKPLPTLVA
jgi:hypothetical protein